MKRTIQRGIIRASQGLLVLTVLIGSGCTQYGPGLGARSSYGQTQAAAEAEDQRMAAEREQRLHTRIQDLEMELQRIDRTIAQQATDLGRQQQSENQGTVLRIQELEKRLSTLEQQRVADKQEIIDKISRSMADLIRKSTAASAPPPVRNTPVRNTSGNQRSSDYGYEHEVAPGETLSAIASAYHVSSKVIIDANSISDPNALRVGQKLFIPE